MNDVEPTKESLTGKAETAPDSQLNTAAAAAGWQMPEPKFQKSSGYLPQGYLEKLGSEAVPRSDGSPPEELPASPVSTPPAPLEIEPQPDISEQLAETTPVEAPVPVVKKRTGARLAMFIVGIFGMIAFLAAFLAVIYFLFIRPSEGGPF